MNILGQHLEINEGRSLLIILLRRDDVKAVYIWCLGFSYVLKSFKLFLDVQVKWLKEKILYPAKIA